MGSFLDPDYVSSPNLGAIWNFCDGPELPWLGIRVWGTKDLFLGLGALGTKGLKPITILFYSKAIHQLQLTV